MFAYHLYVFEETLNYFTAQIAIPPLFSKLFT